MKCAIDLGSQNNLDVWSIWEHIRTKNTNKFWLEKVKDKIDKIESRIEVDNYYPLVIEIEMCAKMCAKMLSHFYESLHVRKLKNEPSQIDP